MKAPSSAARFLRFGIYTLDEQSGELRKNGIKVRLADQPLQLLRLLVNRPGAVVTREEIRAHLWSSDTFVAFDMGLNSAVCKLRDALGDSADNPRFVETLPRRGYRLIAPVEPLPPDPVTEIRLRNRWKAAAAGLVVAVVSAVGALALTRLDLSEPRSVVSLEAQAVYRKGLLAAGGHTADAYITAVKYFEDAVARQPDFAEAYASLAQIQSQLLFVGGVAPPREVAPKAEAAARRALQLDDTLAEAHQTLGTILQVYWRWDEARAEFQRASAVHKLAAEKHRQASHQLTRKGRFDEAAAALDLAQKGDPLSPDALIVAAMRYRGAGQHERAVAALRQAMVIAPQASRAHFQLGLTALQMERADEAIGACEAAVRISRGNPRFQACLGIAYAAAKRVDEARSILDELETHAQQQYVSGFGIALINDLLGNKAEALAAFDRAYQDRAVEFSQMSQYPRFRTIGSDPHFQELIREIGAPR